jgi:hypothetical protein
MVEQSVCSNSTELSASCASASCAATQELPQYFMEPEGSLPYFQVPSTSHYPNPDQSSTYPHILSLTDPS